MYISADETKNINIQLLLAKFLLRLTGGPQGRIKEFGGQG